MGCLVGYGLYWADIIQILRKRAAVDIIWDGHDRLLATTKGYSGQQTSARLTDMAAAKGTSGSTEFPPPRQTVSGTLLMEVNRYACSRTDLRNLSRATLSTEYPVQ